MNHPKRILINGFLYIRADIAKATMDVVVSVLKRRYEVMSHAKSQDEMTTFLRLRGYKSVKYKPGQTITIVVEKAPRKKREPKTNEKSN
jgi:hypothetical protein